MSSKLFMKNKNNKKTNLLTRILHDKKGIYVTTAMKIVIALVTGITVLTGSTYVVKDVVMPQTESKIIEEFDKDYSVENGGSGGSGGSTDIKRSGTVLEGCSYTLANGTVLNAGEDMPFAPTEGDVYKEGDYTYVYRRLISDYYAELDGEFGYDPDDAYEEFYRNSDNEGWSAFVEDNSKSSYGNALSEINGQPITSMYYAFRNCESMTVAPSIPSGVTSIAEAFFCCTSLETAPVIPNSVTCISEAFWFCRSLTSAPVIPSSVTNMSYAFSGCTSLTSAPTIPDGVTSISGAFCDCASLTTAPIIPNSVTDLDNTFFGCTSLASAPTIPDGVTTTDYTFGGCTSLTSAPAIPNSVTSMCGTFSGCTSLTSAPIIPNSVIDMKGTFKNCISLMNAPTIPDSVKYMGSGTLSPSCGTFEGCTSLTSAPIVPNGVVDMTAAFKGCTSLTSASVIPNSVTKMSYAFSGCTSLAGSLECNAEPTSYSNCLKNTQITSITGSCSDTIKTKLLSTK